MWSGLTCVGRNLWICEIHGYRCAIYGSLASAGIHGCLRNLWILRRVGETGASCYNFHSKSIFHTNMQARYFF